MIQDDTRTRRIAELMAMDDVDLEVCTPDEVFWFRPRQLLCTTSDAHVLDKELQEFGGSRVDHWAPNSKCWRPRTASVYSPPRTHMTDLRVTDLERRFLPPDINVPALARFLRDERRGEFENWEQIGPNYLVMGEQWWGGEPDDDPEPLTKAKAQALGLLDPADPPPADGVTVAVIDTGIDPEADKRHDIFSGRYRHEPADHDLGDGNGDGFLDRQAYHGELIAGLISRRAPRSRLNPEAGLNPMGVGDIATICAMIVHLARQEHGRCDIINLSLGGYTDKDVPPSGLQFALDECKRHEVLVVAAAGNNACTRPFFPAFDERVVAVGALEQDGKTKAGFSNFGDWVDAWAVGRKVPGLYGKGDWPATPTGGTVHLDKWVLWSGTSFAAPRVAAAIAEKMTQGMSVQAAKKAVLDNPGSVVDTSGQVISTKPVVS